jgi:hypothetical protein
MPDFPEKRKLWSKRDAYTLSKEACRAGDEDALVLEVPCDSAAVRHRAVCLFAGEGREIKQTGGVVQLSV